MNKPDLKLNISSLKNFRQVFLIAFLFLALFGIWQFLLSPQYSAYSTTQAATKDVEAQLNDINKDLEQIETLQASIEEIEPSDLDKLNKTLPFGENLEEFLSNMHKLAQQSGMIIINMYVNPVDAVVGEEGAVRVSKLSMSLKGSYSDFLDFIRSLERHTRLVDVENITVAAVSGGRTATRTEVLNINVSASVYYLDSIPSSPLFPYGKNLGTILFEQEQFRSLQVLVTVLPTDSPSQPNPFSPQ